MSWQAQSQSFDAAPDGSLAVAVDGTEVLAWAGDDLSPLWKAACEDVVVSVAVATSGVWLVDERGYLASRRLSDGRQELRIQLFESRGVAVAARGQDVLVADARAVVLVRGGIKVLRVALPGVVAMALSTDGRRGALLEAQGALTVVDLETLTPLSRVEVGGRSSDVSWSAAGYWMVSVGHRLRPVQADGREVAPARGALELPGHRVVFSAGGVAAVVQTDAAQAVVVAAQTGEVLGHVRLGRDIVGLSGGPRGALWLGLRRGDVQRVDLLSGERDTGGAHVDRSHAPWSCEVELDHGRMRGMVVTHQAGDGPLVRYVPPPDETTESGWTVGRVLGLIIAVLLTLGLTWWLVTWWLSA